MKEIYNFNYNAQDKILSLFHEFREREVPILINTFNQIFDTFCDLGNMFKDPKTLNDNANWYEIKNYRWIGYRGENFKLLLRYYYGGHLMLIFKDESKTFWGNPFSFVTILSDWELRDLVLQERYEIDDWEYFQPNLTHCIDSFGTTKFNVLWTFPEEKWIKIKTVLKGESITDFDMFQFVLEEIVLINKYIVTEHLMTDLCKKHVGLKFNIPTYTGGCFTEIVEKNGEILFKKIQRDGNTCFEDLWDVVGWDFDKVYTFLKYLKK